MPTIFPTDTTSVTPADGDALLLADASDSNNPKDCTVSDLSTKIRGDIVVGDLPTSIDAANVADGSVSNTEFQYLNGTTSALQTQIDNKQETLSGASLTAVTVAATDKVIIQDTSDGDNIKTVTAQAIADLASGGGGGSGNMNISTYDPATIAEQLVGLTATQTLTNKTLTTPVITLNQGSAPTPTAEGDIQWDTDDDQIKVGDGAGTKTFSDDSKVALVANNLSDISSASTARTNLGIGNVENTALSTWAGSSNINTVGTLTSGNADAIVTKEIQLAVVEWGTDVATGDGKAYFHIGSHMNGLDLIEVHAEVIVAGTTGTTDIQIHNVTQAVDMLSTKITIDSGETGSDTAATAAVIDTTNDDVATNDLIRIDIDAVSTTAPQGLLVSLYFG